MPEFLTRKIGPLPAWGWAAVGAGGLVLYRWWKARQAAAASGSSSAGVTTGTVGSTTPTAEPTATLTTPGGFSYSGPASGVGGILGAAGSGGGSQAAPTTGTVTFPSGATYSGPLSGVSDLGTLASTFGAAAAGAPGSPQTGTAAPGVAYTPASAFAQEGMGYGSYPGQTVTTAQGQFYPLQSASQASGLVAAGQPVYYFPSPGVAEPVTGGISGTPEYGKV